MKALIVYYSLEGNTAYAAEKIAARLQADTLCIEPAKTYPSNGFRKFFWGGKSAVMAETPELLPYEFNADAYNARNKLNSVEAQQVIMKAFLLVHSGANAGRSGIV